MKVGRSMPGAVSDWRISGPRSWETAKNVVDPSPGYLRVVVELGVVVAWSKKGGRSD